MEGTQGARGFEGKDLFQASMWGKSSREAVGVELDKLREWKREEMAARTGPHRGGKRIDPRMVGLPPGEAGLVQRCLRMRNHSSVKRPLMGASGRSFPRGEDVRSNARSEGADDWTEGFKRVVAKNGI